MNLKVWIYLTYYMPHLEWDPYANGIFAVTLPENTLWTPDIVFFDATDVSYDAYSNQTIFFQRGLVIAKSTTVNLKLTCSMTVRYFPYDTQVAKSLTL